MRFERMTKTYQFITDRNLDTVEQVEDYKSKCYQTIEMLKEDQLKSKNISSKKEKLYKSTNKGLECLKNRIGFFWTAIPR